MSNLKGDSTVASSRNLLGLPAVDPQSLKDRLVFTAEKPVPIPGSGSVIVTTIPKQKFAMRASSDKKPEFLVSLPQHIEHFIQSIVSSLH